MTDPVTVPSGTANSNQPADKQMPPPDDVTLAVPSDSSNDSNAHTEVNVIGVSSETQAQPKTSIDTSDVTLALPKEAEASDARPTVAEAPSPVSAADQTLALADTPTRPVSDQSPTSFLVDSPESSGTLLDAHLDPCPPGQVTDRAHPVIPRATSPGLPLPDAPSTIAHGSPAKTGVMPALALPTLKNYEVLGELGRGGMGVVYKARQKGLNRIVALKMILSAGRARPDELTRFRAEAEAVAYLHHPNIVQVYEVGTHEGMPFFSLEFCSGGTLADRIGGKPQQPYLAARIIRDLARAIHHAHQRNILHRDLKPANVLLTPADPERDALNPKTKKVIPPPRSRSERVPLEHCVPKITDFGLAKRLENDAGQTRDGSVMGTPSYMAPEQAQGRVRELGPPADVYALGAILYDLLTGNPPFRGDTVMDTLHQVIHSEPSSPKKIHAKIPADLNTICLKCLEKDPSRRYASADALVEDLSRFLNGEPIMARPAPWWEKTIKWGRRHPAGAALVLVSIFGFAGLTAGGYILARHESTRAAEETELKNVAQQEKAEADVQRDRAEQLKGLAEIRFRKACDAVDSLLARVGHERLAHEPRMEQIRRELLQKAVAFYEGFLRERGDDPELKWQTARTQKNLGDIQEMLGNIDLAEQRYRAAIDVFEELHKEAPADRRYTRDLAATQHNFGLLLSEAGRSSEAEKALRAGRDLRSSLLTSSIDNETRRELAASDHALGLLLERQGDLKAAEAAYHTALEQEQKVAGTAEPNEEQAKAWREMARAENSLGRVAEVSGRTKQAEQFFESACKTLAVLVSKAPNIPELRQELGQTYTNLGRLRRDSDPAAAAKDYTEAVRIAEKLVADFPATPVYRQDLASALNNLGVLLLAEGRGEEADKVFGRSLSLKERLAAEIHWIADYRRDFGAGLNNHGIRLKTQDRPREADKVFARAISELTDLVAMHGDVPDYKRELARTLVNRALLQQADGKPGEAVSLLKEARALQEKLASHRDALPEYRSELARTRAALGLLYLLRGQGKASSDGLKDMTRAEVEYRAALSQFEELAKEHPKDPDFRYQQALVANALAGLLADQGQTTNARTLWEQADGLLQPLADQHPDVPGYSLDLGRTLNNQARNYALARELKIATDLWRRARAALADLVKRYPKETAPRQELSLTERNLANLALLSNQLDEATMAFRRAVTALEELPPEPPPGLAYRHDLMERHRDLAEQLATGASPREVEKERRRVVELCRSLVKDAPDNPQLANDLGGAADALATFLMVQNRLKDSRLLMEEAVNARRAALKLSATPAATQFLIAQLANFTELLFQLGDHAAAAAAVGEMLGLVPADWPGHHETAAALARCAGLATTDKTLSDAQRGETARGYANRALAELKTAVKGGFKDGAYLEKTREFDAIRQRDDFKELVKKLKG